MTRFSFDLSKLKPLNKQDLDKLIKTHSHTGYDYSERFSWQDGGKTPVTIVAVDTNNDDESVGNSSNTDNNTADTLLTTFRNLYEECECEFEPLPVPLNDSDLVALSSWVNDRVESGNAETMERDEFLALFRIQLNSVMGSGESKCQNLLELLVTNQLQRDMFDITSNVLNQFKRDLLDIVSDFVFPMDDREYEENAEKILVANFQNHPSKQVLRNAWESWH